MQTKLLKYLHSFIKLSGNFKLQEFFVIRKPENAHLIFWPSKAQNIQNLEKYGIEMTLTSILTYLHNLN